MKTIKHISIAILIIILSFVISKYVDSTNPILPFTTLLITGFFIFNLIIRRSLFFKPYFTSKFNLLTQKYHNQKVYPISKEVLFDKIIEVLEDSHFKLKEVDRGNFELLAISPITWKSWGENLYVSFESHGDETTMKFCSATFFQIYDWGKNEENYGSLLNQIEHSLII